MSAGDERYPGWCCRQIAAQLSQALFTMADLHSQVSDLREENRQLKIKIGSIDIKSEKGETSVQNSTQPTPSSKLSISKFTLIGKDSMEELGNMPAHCELKQPPARPVPNRCPFDSSIGSNYKSDRVVLNVPFKHQLDEEGGEASQAQSLGVFKCDKCESCFPNLDVLTIHQAVHFGRSFHVCKICNAMFLLKADLYQHWATHPNVKQHICQLCGKAYTSKNNYKLHIKTHTGVGLYPCEVCGKAFHSENHLYVHRRIHTGERPFVCQYCDKPFTQKSGLINHTRLHTGEKPFICPSCPKAFTQKSNLNFHLTKHHPLS